jgi:hypothetical protein
MSTTAATPTLGSTMGGRATTTLMLLLAVLVCKASAFLSPFPAPPAHRHALSSSVGRGAAAGAGGGGRHPFLPTPLGRRQQRRSQQRLHAALDTEEKEKEAKAAIVDQKAQLEFERMLAEGKDLLGLVDHLKAHRGGVRLTWDQVCVCVCDVVVVIVGGMPACVLACRPACPGARPPPPPPQHHSP